MTSQRVALFAACVVFGASASAEADYYFFMINPVDPPATAVVGENYAFTVGLIIEDEPNPCGGLYAFVNPHTGGIRIAPSVDFRANGSYRIDVWDTMPNAPGVYLYDVTGHVEDCNLNTILERRWNNIAITVQDGGGGDEGGNGDVESDLDVDRDTFSDPIYIGEMECGDVRIENNGDVTYEIDAVELRERGVSVDWDDDRDGHNEILDPGDDEWYDDFCFTPLAAGTVRLDVIVELEDDDNEYDVDTIRIEVLDPNCVRTQCNGDDRWCVSRFGGNHHLVQGCGDDSVGACVNHRCVGNSVVCDRTDTDRYCENDQCQSRQVSQTITVVTCGNNQHCANGACVVNFNDCVRTECRNDDRWCVDANGNYSRKQQECGDDEVGECRNLRCNNDGDAICDRTNVDRFCLEDRCRQQSVAQIVVADDCNAVLEVCQNGACANRCLLGCFDQCDGDTLVVRACENNVCQEQNRDDCNRFDNREPVERYCSGSAVHSRQQVTDGYCGGVLNTCRTQTSTEELGELDACTDYCDRSISVQNRGCRDGACGDGEPIDCSTRMILDSPVRYCLDDELRQHRRFVHNTCGGGTCNASPERWVLDLHVQNCLWGCNEGTSECNQDPCANIVCENRCSVDAVMACQRIGGRCFYDQVEDCNDRDVIHGDRQFYCNADSTSVRSRQAMDDYFCAAGGCVGRSMWANDRLEERCAGYCNGSESVWGRACQNGACTDGERVDCSTMIILDSPVRYCLDDELRQHRRFVHNTCGGGTCNASPERWINDLHVEDCAAREPWYELLDEYCVDSTPAQSYAVFSWECEDGACALGSAVEEESLGEACAADERCQDGACLQCDARWQCGEWSRCNGPPARDRWCVDRGGCFEDRHDVEECPCEIDRGRWSVDHAIDGDMVEAVITTHGACHDIEVLVEVRETDGTPLDWLLRPEIPGSFSMTLGHGNEHRGPWFATFVEDIGEQAEYRFHILRGEDDLAISDNILHVEPRHLELGTIGALIAGYPPPRDPCPDYGMVTLSYECILARQAAGVHGEITDANTISGEDILEWVVDIWIVDCAVCLTAFIAAGASIYFCPVTFGGSCAVVAPPALSVMGFTCPICIGSEPIGGWAFVRRETAKEAGVLVVRAGAESRRFNIVAEDVVVETTATGARFSYRSEGVPVVEEILWETPTTLPSIRYANPPWLFPGGVHFMNTRQRIPINYAAIEMSEPGMRFATSLFVDEQLPIVAEQFAQQVSRGRYSFLDLLTVEGQELAGIRYVEEIPSGGLARTSVASGELQISTNGFLRNPAVASRKFFGTVLEHEEVHLFFHKRLRNMPDPQRGGNYQTLLEGGLAPRGWNRHAEEYLADRIAFNTLANDEAALSSYQLGIVEQLEAAYRADHEEWVRAWVNVDGSFEQRWKMVRFYNYARDLTHELENTIPAELEAAANAERPEAVAEFRSAANVLRNEDPAVVVRDVHNNVPTEAFDAILRKYRIIVEEARGGGVDRDLVDDTDEPLGPIDPRGLAEQDAGEGDSSDPRVVRRRDGGVSESDASSGELDSTSVDTMELLYVNCDELPSYAFDSPEDCRSQVPTNKRSACDRLVLDSYICPRPGGACACRLNANRSADPSAFFLFALAFALKVRRFRR